MYPFIHAYQFDNFTFFIMWLILRLKMSCFSHQGFLGGGGGGGGVMVFCPRLWVMH